MADRTHRVLGLDGEYLAVLDHEVIVAARGPGVPGADFFPRPADIPQPDDVAGGAWRRQVPWEVAVGGAARLALQQ
ncbi:hypothetical protein D3C86_1990050 [compost metagenome]